MKISEVLSALLEYNRDITATKMGPKLLAAAKGQSIDEVLTQLESIDPTKNKQYVEWLARQYIAGQFALEDSPRIKGVLVNFEKLKPRLPIKDINQYTLHSLEDLIDKTLNVDLDDKSATDTGTFPVTDDSEVLYNGPLGQLAIPKTEEASCELGSGTKWCTSSEENNKFYEYDEEGKLYIWRDRNGEKFQLFIPRNLKNFEFMDDKNKPLDAQKVEYFRKKHPVMSKLFNKIEPQLMKTPLSVYNYALKVIDGPWPEAESMIMQNPNVVYNYALNVIKDRWPEAEHIILAQSELIHKYATEVIKGRWTEAEDEIMKNPSAAHAYAVRVLKGRWPEAEPYIMKDPDVAFRYAAYVIKGRWPEAEPYIMKKLSAALNYAADVIKGPWPEANII